MHGVRSWSSVGDHSGPGRGMRCLQDVMARGVETLAETSLGAVMRFSKPLLVIDVETTGCDETLHDVCEIGAVLLDMHLNELDSYKSYVKPFSGHRDSKAMNVHLIQEATLAVAPEFKEVVAHVGAMLFRDNVEMPILAGWGVDFDRRFLRAGFKKAGLSWPFGHRVFDVRTVLVWECACRGLKYDTETGKGLQDGMDAVGLKFQGAAHGAYADAKNTADLLIHLADYRST